MKEDENPYNFFMKCNELRDLMERNHKHVIPMETYMEDILSKLPSNYRPKKIEIQRKNEKKKITDDTDLMLELMEEFSELFPEKNVDGTLLQEETSTEDAALVTQFKGRCNKCGEYGHMARDCTGSKGSNDQGRNSRGSGRGNGRGYGRGYGR